MKVKKLYDKKAKSGEAGDGIVTKRAAWSFAGETAKSFEKHVRSSVPLFDLGHDLICDLSDFFVQEQSICYELGTSVGTLTRKLAEHHSHKPKVKWIGLDSEADMIAEAKKHTSDSSQRIEFLERDINTFDFQASDLIVSYYTIQFVPPYLRQKLIDKLYNSLNWGGALIVFEKVRAGDARFQDYMVQLYNDYKLKQGYTPEQIMNKSSSLKSVLEPFSSQANIDMFKRAGFEDVMSIQKWVCFEGFLCIK